MIQFELCWKVKCRDCDFEDIVPSWDSSRQMAAAHINYEWEQDHPNAMHNVEITEFTEVSKS